MSQCELPKINVTPAQAQEILKKAKTIAIVGISNEPTKDSYEVAAYLQAHGYRIIPVNPKYPEILGEKCYPSLQAIPEEVDIVDVFRRAEAIPEIAEATLALAQHPKVFWMQLGIIHNGAAAKLQKAGLTVVQNQCIKIVHSQMGAKA